MARDVFIYPEDNIKVPTTEFEREKFKKYKLINIQIKYKLWQLFDGRKNTSY